MESIFDHNPTSAEIELFTEGFSKKYYLTNKPDFLIADIAIMYADRGNTQKSNEYWAKIPEFHAAYKLDRGRDWKPIAVDEI